MAITLIGFAYEADIHCVDCARERFGPAVDEDILFDHEGNPVSAFYGFQRGEFEGPIHCSDCNIEL